MRKRLLRSRSGFEKPESREEAIMQNILGASNVLEPSESNIEEILKSILYNTPYTKEAEFEIEKILLAIKNNGTYDGEGESRDMKILIAILNDLDYTEEAESRIEELFIEWLQQRQQIKVLEGVPPLTFTARGLPLINYLIEGNTVQNGTPTPDSPIMPQGTGERTGNLCATENFANSTTDTRSFLQLAIMCYYGSDFVGRATFSGGTQLLDIKTTGNKQILFTVTAENCNRLFIKHNGATRDISISNVYGAFSGDYNISFDCNGTNPTVVDGISLENIMLNSGSTALPYEPYGYKIPISCGSVTTPVYLGEVQSTRKIKQITLKGGEITTVDVSVNQALISITDRSLGVAPISSHYKGKFVTGWNQLSDGECGLINNGATIRICDTVNVTSATAYNNYLTQQYNNGTPVTIWYVLATEETGIVNEPLMKIGDYADSISMEQTGIEIPTINGSNTFDVDTTVKPSNVYIEYK